MQRTTIIQLYSNIYIYTYSHTTIQLYTVYNYTTIQLVSERNLIYAMMIFKNIRSLFDDHLQARTHVRTEEHTRPHTHASVRKNLRGSIATQVCLFLYFCQINEQGEIICY